MRGFLASSIGVTCAAALALPLTPSAAATAARPALGAEVATSGRTVAGPAVRQEDAESSVPGSTQALPLAALTRDRDVGGPSEWGLSPRGVRHFSLVGVTWDAPDNELHGRVQVRTRALGTGAWSGWQDLDTHNGEHAADPGTEEPTSGRVRGSTAPLWVGESDGVEVRVTAEAAGPRPDDGPEGEDGVRGGGDDSAAHPEAAAILPAGLRLELVDPGEPAPEKADPAGAPRPGSLNPETVETAEVLVASGANAELAPVGAVEIPALGRAETERELLALRGNELTEAQRAKPYIGPRPRIVTRRGWGANEGWRERQFAYTKKVKAAFVHHTATGSKYSCSQAPSLIRGIYRYHVKSMGWRDVGYNFLVDKCGNIYEGRAGGVAKPVLGAHTLGFNSNSMGIAVLGSYGATKPTKASVKAVARLTAWKLGLYGANPRGKTYLTSGGGNLYRKGKNVRLNVISGHRDGYSTECPGRQLYRKLGSARASAARYQGR
ncbi:peptidoglycan recognition protein family protein [Streptomyces viridochromogenes]|uniref:peptidoglycan recognition protein family protein n=1 Tax=Streptomyces viridochromogenes TaxID=1938 RepID=UPI00069E3F24|nr:peptidoglycan recognition protein [Streptomyces viridochromogenes]KOG08288.1 N-acetylmuramoyl-L-alanine amidase [Streptomyces viridochromogenes]KOG24856.1 N-acetylmuramoyl-L-alanine amidase [Streptomyces viridochromogenes]